MSAPYQKIVNSLKRRRKAATIADICASTALSLETVRELLPKAADEYSGHLQVTEAGEILYSFPNGFTSRYRGFYPAFKKVCRAVSKALGKMLEFLFKAWIMLTLIGYFIFFIALALAAVFLSMAAQSKSSSSRRSGSLFAPNLFSLVWRIWFFHEVTKPRYTGYAPVTKTAEKRPMHKAVFSFVFGDGDPNKDFTAGEDKAVITYIQSNKGIISLAEFMAFKGINSLDAEREILSFCVRFGGSPEVTEEGAIFYRFNELLQRADTGKFTELSPLIKHLKSFSANPKTSNVSFAFINAVNLIFGSYFLYHALNTGFIASEAQMRGASFFYSFTHILFESFITPDPVSIIMVLLGLFPVIFSILFWLIPALRGILLSRENKNIKLQNFMKLGYNKIWSNPQKVRVKDFNAQAVECKPKNMEQAAERCIKNIGAFSSPDVTVGEDGQICYSFNELEREKESVNKEREISSFG